MAPDPTRRFVALSASAALLPASALPALAAAEPDPIFAALAAERVAEDRFCDASVAWSDGPISFDPALKPAADEAADAYYATLRTTMATVPTTTAGLLALVDRFEATIDGIMVSADRDGLTALLGTVRAFVGGRS